MSLSKSFDDLGVAELRRSAIEDFAVEVGEKDSKKMVIAALVESGVKWSDYVAQHPEVVPAPERTPEPARAGEVITTGVPAEAKNTTPESGESEGTVLIKMDRENPLYEAAGHKFTSDHPYALVTEKEADYILRNEEGFRQAFPSELADYYS